MLYKKILFFVSFCFCVQTMSAQTIRQKTVKRLQNLMQRGYMFGHQDDPFYGLTWQWERGRSDVLEAAGDYPAVMGFDLGGVEVGDEKNLDSVPFTRIREELLAHVKRGGIVTVSWHPRNPLTGGTAWDNSDSTVVRSILPGGPMHQKFLLWMKNVKTTSGLYPSSSDPGMRITAHGSGGGRNFARHRNINLYGVCCKTIFSVKAWTTLYGAIHLTLTAIAQKQNFLNGILGKTVLTS